MEKEVLGGARDRLVIRWLLIALSFLVVVIFGLIGAVMYLGERGSILEDENVGIVMGQNQLVASDANMEINEILNRLKEMEK